MAVIIVEEAKQDARHEPHTLEDVCKELVLQQVWPGPKEFKTVRLPSRSSTFARSASDSDANLLGVL